MVLRKCYKSSLEYGWLERGRNYDECHRMLSTNASALLSTGGPVQPTIVAFDP
jgi:hypothetical protein